MKTIENKIIKMGMVLIVLINFFCTNLKSQTLTYGELMIVNNTGTATGKLIKIDIYPVGAIFSGGNQYSFDARYVIPNSNGMIYGYTDTLNFNQNLSEDQWTTKINFDATSERDLCKTSLGYGKYRIDFYSGPDQDDFTFVDYCIIDYSDANYGTANFQGEQKIRIDFRIANEITFNFLSSSTPHDISEVGNHIKVWEQYGSGYPPTVPSKGMFNDTTLSQYQDFPIDATDYGAVDHITPGEFGLNMLVKYDGSNVRQNQILDFKEAQLIIDEGLVFPINQTNEMTIEGKGAKFIARQSSQIEVPSNFVIWVKDSADIDLDETQLSTNSSQVQWRGIRLLDIGSNSKIENTKLEYADTAVYLSNQLLRPFTFKSNTVSVVRSASVFPLKFGLKLYNCYNILIDSNTFSLHELDLTLNKREAAIHITNYENFTPGERQYVINIINNNFENGFYQIDVLGYASNLVPVYISGNTFNNSFYNFLGRKCIGDIKNNNFYNDYDPPEGMVIAASILTNLCVLNYYSNSFESVQYNFQSGVHSYSNLAPVKSEDNALIWIGGRNTLSNTVADNIHTYDGGYVFVNLGENDFTLGNQSYHHIYGEMDDTCTFYYANNNCWYGNNNQASIEVYNGYWELLDYEATPQATCRSEMHPVSFLTFYNDYDVMDTVFITNETSSIISGDAILYANSFKNISLSNINSAITNLKDLINDYPESKYFVPSTMRLYYLYTSLDSLSGQSNTNQLFGSLKSFLEDKMQSYSNNSEFVETCYEVILMSETRMKNYNNALSGYEFIALNNPDSARRMMACLDYLAVTGMVNGSGGGENRKEMNLMRNKDPISKILKSIYQKKAASDSKSNQINTKVTELLYNARHLNKKNKYAAIDREFLEQIESQSVSKLEKTPGIKSELSRLRVNNFPNPFNPITNIVFTIPISGFVTIKVYDASGRELKTVINEFKNAGDYVTRFDGTDFSTGVYFYKIQSGNLIVVRKLILIK